MADPMNACKSLGIGMLAAPRGLGLSACRARIGRRDAASPMDRAKADAVFMSPSANDSNDCMPFANSAARFGSGSCSPRPGMILLHDVPPAILLLSESKEFAAYSRAISTSIVPVPIRSGLCPFPSSRTVGGSARTPTGGFGGSKQRLFHRRLAAAGASLLTRENSRNRLLNSNNSGESSRSGDVSRRSSDSIYTLSFSFSTSIAATSAAKVLPQGTVKKNILENGIGTNATMFYGHFRLDSKSLLLCNREMSKTPPEKNRGKREKAHFVVGCK